MAEINYSKHSGGSSTHIPLNISLIKYFNIRGVLELGAGFRSTDMFADHVEYLTSIETNKDFIDRVRENFWTGILKLFLASLTCPTYALERFYNR